MLNNDTHVHIHVPRDSVGLSPTAVEFGAGDVGWQALGPSIALTTLSTVVVALRWYTRCRLVQCVGFDDYIILFSLILAWVMTGLIGAGVHHGIGKYSNEVNVSMIAKLIVAQNTVWSITVNVTKASILAQYLRFLDDRRARNACYILIVSLLPAACWGIFGGIFLCNPVRKLWNPNLPGHCRDAQTYWASVAGVDIGLDFLVLLLPIPWISGLHLPRKQKVATMLVFLLGFLVCAVSVVRVATVIGVAKQGDMVMSGIWSIIWSITEANVGIICASLLALRALVVKLCPKLLVETEPPKHALRLPMVENAEPVWMSTDSQAPTLGPGGSMSTMGKCKSPSPPSSWRAQPSLGPCGEADNGPLRSHHKPVDSGGGNLDLTQFLEEDIEKG